jgi:hypothetical protein
MMAYLTDNYGLRVAHGLLRSARSFEDASARAKDDADVVRARNLGLAAAELYRIAGDLLPDSKVNQRMALNLKGLELQAVIRQLQTPQEAAQAAESRRSGDAAVKAMHRRREAQVRGELKLIGLTESQIKTALTRLIASPRFLRVQVQDAAGGSFFGMETVNPAVAVPNIGKTGWCEPNAFCPELGRTNPRITLDDGTVIWGYQCWWAEIDYDYGSETSQKSGQMSRSEGSAL